MGGIRVCSKDGLIVSDVGSGFTDEQRKLGVAAWLEIVGEIVTVKFNGITKPNEELLMWVVSESVAKMG